MNVSFGSLADLHSPTGYGPKDLAEIDNPVQVTPLFFHRPSMTSTYDSAERIATPPPVSDLDDEQIRTMLALLERKKLSVSSSFQRGRIEESSGIAS